MSNRLADVRALLRRLRNAGHAYDHAQEREPALLAGADDLAPLPARPATFDVEREVRSVLEAIAITARPSPVRLEIAIEPELTLRADRAAFRHVLSEVMRQTGLPASCGRVLVTAVRRGGWVEVSVSDDRIGDDRRARQDALRPSERLTARQGGTLEVAVWPDQGATVLARWPVGAPPMVDSDRDPLLPQKITSAV